MISTRTCSLLLLLAAVLLSACTAFTGTLPVKASAGPCAAQRNNNVHVARASRKEQGGAEVKVEHEVQALKKIILDEAAGTSNGLKASSQQCNAISKAVNSLVALNPTEDLTTSELATGMWNLVYTTTPGASGGKLGPFVGEVQQEVDIAAGLYINYVRLGPLTGVLEATWEVVNKKQWKVVFKTIAFSLWGQQLVKKDLRQAGLWTLSYLDDDMRILTARSLERDTGNLYVLARA